MNNIKYNLDERMPLKALLVYGLEWFIIIIPTLIILAVLIGNVLYTDPAGKILYAQKIFALAGISLLIQIFFGHRLPVLIGPAAVLLVGIITAGSNGLDAVYTAIILGGVMLCIVSYSGLLKKFTSLFTPRIIAVILGLIALTLAPTILQLIFANREAPLFEFLLTTGLMIVMIVLNRLFRGIWKSTTVLWGLIIGSIIYGIKFPESLDFMPIQYSDLPWNDLFISSFKFDPGVLLAFFFCYIALFINEVGSIQAVDKSLGAGDSDNRTKKGLRMTGISNILSGLFGTIGTVDYSISPGIIMNTGCASRYTLIPTGIGLIICALFPNLLFFICDIPQMILGIVLLFIMVSQLGASLQMMSVKDVVRNFSDCTTMAMPIMLAIFVAFLPQEVVNSIPMILRPIATNGFVVGVISVLFMEHIINKNTDGKKLKKH